MTAPQAAAPWRVAIDAELDDLVRQLRAGFDVAPARCARLEGAIAAAIAAGLVPAAILHRHVRDRLQGCPAIAEVGADGALMLHLRQRRAPVYPSAPAAG